MVHRRTSRAARGGGAAAAGTGQRGWDGGQCAGIPVPPATWTPRPPPFPRRVFRAEHEDALRPLPSPQVFPCRAPKGDATVVRGVVGWDSECRRGRCGAVGVRKGRVIATPRGAEAMGSRSLQHNINTCTSTLLCFPIFVSGDPPRGRGGPSLPIPNVSICACAYNGWV